MPVEEQDTALARALRGEEHGFADLYREYNPMLAKYVAARMPWATEEVLSDIWLDVARGLPRFRGNDDEGFRKLLFTIASRRLIDVRRRRTPEAIAMVPEVPDAELGPAERAEADAGYRRVLEAVSMLADDQREVVLLRTVANLDVAAVAEITGRRPGAVRVMQHRGLLKLREILSGDR